MSSAIIAWIVRRPGWVFGLLAMLTALAGWAAKDLSFDSSVRIWFLESDPELQTYDRFLSTFGTDEIAVIGVLTDDVFRPEVLEDLDRLTRALEKVPGVDRARSLTNVRVAQATPDGIEVQALWPATSSVARERANADDTVRGVLVTNDGQGAMILVGLDPSATQLEQKAAILSAIRRVIAEVQIGHGEVIVGGTPSIDEAVLRYARADMQRLGSLAALAIFIVCLVAFRSWLSAILPFVVVGMSLMWTFGVMAVLGIDLNLVSQALPTLLLAVGTADSIHLLIDHAERRRLGESPKEAAEQTAMSMLLPCAFTSLTTAAGLLSLSVSRLRPVAELGLCAALGVLFAFICSFALIPAALSLRSATASAHGLDRIGPWLERFSRPSPTTARAIAAASAALVLASIFAITRLEVGTSPLAYFSADDPVRRDIETIDQRLGGSTSIELFVESPDDRLVSVASMKRMEAFQAWLQTLPSIERVVSVTTIARSVHRAIDGTDSLPTGEDQLAQSLLLVEGESSLDEILSSDHRSARISARVRMSQAKALLGHLDEIEGRIASELEVEGIQARPTGFVKLMAEMEIYIVDSQVESFLLALAVISLAMIFVLRSVRLGLIALFPNLAPVLIGLGVMSLLGIALDPGTVMVAGTTLGLVVDDTVHILTAARRNMSRGMPLASAVEAAVRSVGRAVSLTSAVLMLGFSALAFGQFRPNAAFGFVAALVIGLAWLADIVMLPALLRISPRRSESDRSSAPAR